MATLRQWAQGARPRTFPNALAPVLLGSAAAAADGGGGFLWWKALAALIVALGFVIGVNYANDYSDGIRGTDDERIGPMRLVGSKAAAPGAVLRAAVASFAAAVVAGLVLAATSSWWLVVLGAGCLALAWFYTGGTNPYGYKGYGEVAVFLCFGLAAVLGSELSQTGRISASGALCAVGAGSFSAAVLAVNNLRDIDGDRASGKRTLAVRLGEPRARLLYLALAAAPFLITLGLAVIHPWTLLSLLAALILVKPASEVRHGARGQALIGALGATGAAMLAWAALTAAALCLFERGLL
ncbi:1,4-dihydroxy-2-naphthoateoctaprenyltransferase [Segniliparus rotundus DSM 44985]|uniref:1,4-dihydroxy-2-naphthoate octaprenyltransferase n=1 Tax=Segniliparus rotundus (strain ATCC BAA-972 / CDC 1076 / CIP 108378 / DSM 44985 / JCM 13578) TaxID=640132 RepID=D6Z868_SEGRD|nr:1,4-dihydroxy-2-naphthoate polyprenyltransferase [Segniliparus rotundus]ADG98148.1 1,4-dihydroxy-2-naphthoateoctaprenyltransferase [Segniliparus rotundus DSM 44985]